MKRYQLLFIYRYFDHQLLFFKSSITAVDSILKFPVSNLNCLILYLEAHKYYMYIVILYQPTSAL